MSLKLEKSILKAPASTRKVKVESEREMYIDIMRKYGVNADIKDDKFNFVIDCIRNNSVNVTKEEAVDIIKQTRLTRWSDPIEDVTEENIHMSYDGKVFWAEDLKDQKSRLRKVFFVKIKGTDGEILKKFDDHYLFFNKYNAEPENKEEEEMQLNNMRRFIRANKYETLGITKYDYEENKVITKEYKNKDGEPIKQKTGLLYKCECGAYEPINEFEATIVIEGKINTIYDIEYDIEDDIEDDEKSEDVVNLFIASAMLLNVKCSSCNEMFNTRKIAYLDRDSSVHGTIFRGVFNDLDKNGKITLSTISCIRNLVGDKCFTRKISNKVVINTHTGRSYLLPRYDINTKKKKGTVRQLSSINIYNIGDFKISIPELLKTGETIEEYIIKNKILNEKAVIPFEKYLRDAMMTESSNHYYHEEIVNSLDDIISGKEAPKEMKMHIDNALNHAQRLEVLVLYNQNPYVPYSTYAKLADIKKYQHYNGNDYIYLPSKIRNIKKVRQTDLIKNLNTLFSIKSKGEKKFINNAINKLDAYSYLMRVKKIFKNQDNINKFMLANKYNYTHSNFNFNSVDIYENKYIYALIEKFGETAVANAITKDTIERNAEIEKRTSEEKEKENTSQSFYYNVFSDSQTANYHYYRDTIENYRKIIQVYPEYQFPCDRLRLKELHDKIAKDANKIKGKKVTYIYEDEFMKMYDNKVINGITFKVALSNRRLTAIGSQMGICVGGYANRVESGKLFIVYMKKDNEYIGCLEISHDAKLHQAKAKYNYKLKEAEQIALKEYCLMTNLTTDTCDVPEGYNTHSVSTNPLVSYAKAIKLSTTIEGDMKKLLESNEDDELYLQNRAYTQYEAEDMLAVF